MSPQTIQVKNYIDRGIQTEVQDLPFEQASGPTLAETDSAYSSNTHSLATLAEPSVALHLSPTPSPFASCHTSRRPQLPYSRPTESHVLAKRVVSLPERSFDDMGAVHDVAGMRVVSLPEPMKCLPQSTDNASYLNSFGTSADTSCVSSRSNSGDRELYAYPELDIPRTPTPPSSPDSVLIIDNDVHLPNLFLYQPGHSHKNTVTEDDGGAHQIYFYFLHQGIIIVGWITWASSPPRPIPALHGPSSLPYARCPS